MIIAVIGAAYAIFVITTNVSIPCVFRLITGLKCPGCGMTRMCIALLRLDFVTAFKANPAAFCLIPLMAITVGRMIFVYIKYDRRREKITRASVYFMIVVLVAFGVVRNILHL